MDADSFLFNLFFNATLSFWVGCAVVFLSLRIFRVNTSYWKMFLMTLPFAKIVWDLARGIPKHSFAWTGMNPLWLPPKHSILSIGLGFETYGPAIYLATEVRDIAGRLYSISLADYIDAFLTTRVWEYFVPTLLACGLIVSVVLVARRLGNLFFFSRYRQRDRRSEKCETVETRTLWIRSVDIYVSDAFEGTPFAGGVIKPYVCLPRGTFEQLSSDELTAVLGHELAHIRSFDILITLVVKTLGDIFWFIPGYKWLSRQVDRMREVLADGWALEHGAVALSLALALVKVQAMQMDPWHGSLQSALCRRKSLLKERVERLTVTESAEACPAWAWRTSYLRVVIVVWTVGCVLMSTFGGNH